MKRLIGIEGDWLLAAGHPDVIKVPKVWSWIVRDSRSNGSNDTSAEALASSNVSCKCK